MDVSPTRCGRCGHLTHMSPISGQVVTGTSRGPIYETAYKCDNCGRVNVECEYLWGGGLEVTDEEWLPPHRQHRDFPDVPQHIAAAATEASLCLSVGAHRACGALARAVVEATAKDKKATGRTLEDRINSLHEADHIRKHTAEQAHEVRYFGNEMAHGDFIEVVAKEEAEEIFQLMVEVLDEVYQSPARLERTRAARLAKKSDGPGPRDKR